MPIKILTILTLVLILGLSLPASCAQPEKNANDMQMANNLMAKNQSRSAITCLNRVIEKEPKSAQAYCLRGSARFTLEEISLAKADLDMAIKLNPLLPFAHYKRAQVYGEEGNLKMALSESGKAIALAGDKADSSWFQDRAAWLVLDGNKKQAIDEYGKAIRANPTNLWAHYFRANLYFNDGLYDKALSDLNIACANRKESGFARFCELRAKCFDKLGKHSLAENDRKASHTEALKDFNDFQIGPATK